MPETIQKQSSLDEFLFVVSKRSLHKAHTTKKHNRSLAETVFEYLDAGGKLEGLDCDL